jgi:hypothetical protein
LLTDKKTGSKVVPGNLGTNTAKGTPTNFGISLFSSRNNVVIHVCDEAKKKTQDFKCDRSLLLQHMKYFNKYLAGQKNLDEIDISVHCDILIFDWLMKYVHG